MLQSFKLTGFDHPVATVHSYCPGVTRSCCDTPSDMRSYENWQGNNEDVVEKYYEYMVNGINYLLGWSQEAYLLAMKFKNQELYVNNGHGVLLGEKLLRDTQNLTVVDNYPFIDLYFELY